MSAAVALPTGARVEMFATVLRASAVLRAAQLAMWLWVPVAYGVARFSSVVFIGYVLAVAWTVVLFSIALRRHSLALRWVLADVAIAVACAVVVSRSFPVGDASSPRNWVVAPI